VDDDPRYEVKHERAEAALRGIAKAIADATPPGFGFALFLFTYGEGGATFYISSAQRDDVRRLLAEWLRKEGGQ
jgi:hypothetical protein